MSERTTSLYVHLPFCKRICTYCDFTKNYLDQEMAELYVTALEQEILLKKFQKKQFSTIYIGGGTPSSLPLPLLKRLLSILSELLNDEEAYEFSIEANPKDIIIAFIAAIKQFPINRISIGVQSFNHKILTYLGRDHNTDDVRFALDMLFSAGYKNVSVDLMYGIPGQKKHDVLKDINRLIKYKIPHISLYSLEIHPHTKLFNSKEVAQSDTIQRQIYDSALKLFRKNLYIRYEVSNFALPGFLCQHNLKYWRAEEYEAIGIGATSFIDGKRIKNTCSISKYNRLEFGKDVEELSKNSRITEFIMLKLRLEEGISYSQFREIFGIDFQIFNAAIENLRQRKLIIASDNYLRVSDEGMILLDQVILTFLNCLKEEYE